MQGDSLPGSKRGPFLREVSTCFSLFPPTALGGGQSSMFYSLRQKVLPMRSNGGKSGAHGLLRGWIEQDVQLYVFMFIKRTFDL